MPVLYSRVHATWNKAAMRQANKSGTNSVSEVNSLICSNRWGESDMKYKLLKLRFDNGVIYGENILPHW